MNIEHSGGDGWTILHGDTLKIIRRFKPQVFDAVITDPPYSSVGWKAAEKNRTTTQKYSSCDKGFPEFDGDNRDQRSWTHWMAEWLYDNSPYYSPTVTYNWSSDGANFSYSFSRSISVTPGNEITLPSASDIGADTSLAGVLEGWGVTRSEVMYQPGEVIAAPYTSQTYYAIWKTGVVFTDELTGVNTTIDGSVSGDVVEVPVLTPPDDSYIFAGWVDKSNGEYIPADETEYTLSGNGASFEALWKKIEISDVSASPYDINAVPVDTQVDISFTIGNLGNENMRNSVVDLTSDSEGVEIQKGHGRVPSLPAGKDIYATGLRVVATEPGSHDLTIAFTDRDGDTWTQDFQIQAE